MEKVIEFIATDGLVMVPTLLILGEFIKRSQYIKNELIPFILLVISMILTPLILGGFSADNIVQSVLVTGVSVLGNQMYKQATYLSKEE
ncbi:phage holin family protein (plasmid) [Vagococcus lutrae]|uniref:Phage holin family protein n=1 Tax=Vagococcus lutrae TaxID=81947 RepID=A0AAE9XG93_9ENTE|nr:phage holin family protein [Vagococcus lutrae]MCO7151757.1 phage holin family protein [Vagococcus lutrae]MDT2818653.1 phage holin family protein [Vagococcus lutrae]MDT2843779.1 phage holin family protein [Vagococcus lutrae]UQF11369.1 phage holin family protein [Vagococcus lutrae]UQF24202.1 phage holin family protein [Vagococcus lutrae]